MARLSQWKVTWRLSSWGKNMCTKRSSGKAQYLPMIRECAVQVLLTEMGPVPGLELWETMCRLSELAASYL